MNKLGLVETRHQDADMQADSGEGLASEEYQQIAEAIPQLVWTANPDGAANYFNRQWVEYTGLPKTALIQWGWKQVLHPDDLERTLDTWETARRDGQLYEIEYRIRGTGGDFHWFLGRAYPVRDTLGNIIRWFGTSTDIDDQKRNEQVLRESEQRFQTLADTAPVMVWMSEPDTLCSFFNKPWLEFTGRAIEQELGNGWTDNVHPDDIERCLDTYLTHFHKQHPFRMEYRMHRANGEYRWMLGTGVPRYTPDGSFAGYIGSCIDITERRESEMLLREEAETLEVLNRIGQILSAELDMQKLVQAVTDAATTLIGALYGSFFYNTIDDSGESYLLFTLSGLPRERFAHVPMPRATDLFGPTYRGEGVIRIDDVHIDPRYGKNSPYYGMPPGHPPVTSFLAVPVVSRSGMVLGGLFFGHPDTGVFTQRHERTILGLAAQTAIAMDNARLFSATQQEIAERRRTEEELQRTKETAVAANNAKSQFLAVLSHELRTPLNPILTAVQAIEEAQDLPKDFRLFVDVIHRNIELEARLIDDLLDVTRIDREKLDLNIETVDAHALIRHVVEMCEAERRAANLSLTVDLAAVLNCVNADPARMQQVFWNLMTNALKFTPSGGHITIHTYNDSLNRLIIEISDNGIGIASEDLPRIFDTFEQGERTITRRYGGLGLGLAISKSLIELHGGSISVTSGGKDKGATFRVELMATEVQTQRQTSAPAVSPTASSAPLQILIVDDHVDTSKVMKIMLERRGYQVETADSVGSAIQAGRSRPFDLLISDIGLPDGSGIDLLREFSKEQQIPAIALSGFGMEEDIERSRNAGFHSHLVKPVSFQSLHDIILQIFAERTEV
jgi:PAS domain S-box-containing protein